MSKKTGYIPTQDDTNESNIKTKLLSEEREIVLVMNDRERKWEASVSSPTYMKKFIKQGWKCTHVSHYKDGTVCTMFFEAPSEKSISIGKYERPKRHMTEEQRHAISERFKKYHK
ncbi:hypothetical protein LJC58_10420 [Lachnospiraceae bacterium OttesenSCG-928-D06]|nr:hypothetical protein [Lachnospiraceae bacterium OttesenSCG-928-D06]